MKLYDKQGNVVMDLIHIAREEDDIVLKARLMGALVTYIYLKPADLWSLKNFLPWSVVCYVPGIILKGWTGALKTQTQRHCSKMKRWYDVRVLRR
jgi:hypothetical protein